MSAARTLLAFQPPARSTPQMAAVSFPARYTGQTHALYAFQLRQWFTWRQGNGLDPLVGVQRPHVELYIRGLGERADGLLGGDDDARRCEGTSASRTSTVCSRLTRRATHGCRRWGATSPTPSGWSLELIRFLQVAQTISVHHGALPCLLGINAVRASEAAAVRIEDYADPARAPGAAPGRQGQQAGHDAPHRPRPACPGGLPGRTNIGAASAAAGLRPADRPAGRVPDGAAHRHDRRNPPPHQPALTAPRRDHQRPRRRRPRCVTPRSWPAMPTPAPPSTTTAPAGTSTDTACTSSPPTSPASRPSRSHQRRYRLLTQAAVLWARACRVEDVRSAGICNCLGRGSCSGV